MLSRLDYFCALFHNALLYQINRLRKVILSAASFFQLKHCKLIDVFDLNWLPVQGRLDFAILRLVAKRLYINTLPEYLTFELKAQSRSSLRNATEKLIVAPNEKNTFSAIAEKLYNDLPKNIRDESDYNKFLNESKHYITDRELSKCLTM